MSISENIEVIREKIYETASRCNRHAEDITLLAVTKTVNVDLIRHAIDTGIQEIGENRVQEAKMKFGEINREVHWNLIGHLQTNKVKNAVEMFDLIQSVDRMEVAQEIQKRASGINKKQRILIQVNTSAEETKSGCLPEETESLVRDCSLLPNLQVEGLMTIGPLTDDIEKVRTSFQTLKGLFDNITRLQIRNVIMRHLSMGMSQDYPVAIEEGSTMIRIGTAIFGERQSPVKEMI
jgi:PLP dependent protein